MKAAISFLVLVFLSFLGLAFWHEGEQNRRIRALEQRVTAPATTPVAAPASSDPSRAERIERLIQGVSDDLKRVPPGSFTPRD